MISKLNLYIIIILTIFTYSCTDSNISLVKKGTLEFDKSITIGDAFDNFKYFKTINWENLTTENKRELVQFSGEFDWTKDGEVANLIQTNKKISAEMQNISKISVVFQFIMNKDSTFEVGWCGINALKDGVLINSGDKSDLDECFVMMKSIYENDSKLLKSIVYEFDVPENVQMLSFLSMVTGGKSKSNIFERFYSATSDSKVLD